MEGHGTQTTVHNEPDKHTNKDVYIMQYRKGVNTYFMERKKVSRKEYAIRQIAFMREDFNRWVTGEEVHHSPTDNELVEHFIKSGAAAKFATEYEIDDSL